MSIIYDRTAINQAMQSLQPPKAPCSNGRPICHECYCDLGNPPSGVVTCKGCGETNYIEVCGK